MIAPYDVLTLKISKYAPAHADPKRLIQSDRWKCAGGYKNGWQRRKLHHILSSLKKIARQAKGIVLFVCKISTQLAAI